MAFPFLIQGSNIVLVIDSKSHTISESHVQYQKIKDAIKAKDWDTVRNLVDMQTVISNYGAGDITITNGTLYWKGTVVHSVLAEKIVSMYAEGFPIDPFVAFMSNLMQNPSHRAVNELYGFLEKGKLPITPDGHFLAYKKVRDDYKDVYSGTIDNSIGAVVKMPRNEVNDNKEQTCSTGLHFCSESYLRGFGGSRIMILKINPRDVVSIPVDYDNAKGRACEYTVVGEVAADAVTTSVVAAVQETGGAAWAQEESTESWSDDTDDAWEDSWESAPYHPETEEPVKSGPLPLAPATTQDYSPSGKALSMTKDAIRKRKARAAKKS